MKNCKWSEEEIKFLIENYPKLGAVECSNFLNRTKRGIEIRANILKLKWLDEIRYESNVKYKKEMVEDAVKKSFCYADVIRYFGLIPQAGNFKLFKNKIKKYNIDISHFLSVGQLSKLRANNKTVKFNNKKNIFEILVENSTFSTTIIKKRLYEEGLKEKKCEMCGQSEDWYGKKMTLILDHINGNHFDNRIENLRILCPNCNSTLDTHCSRNRKIKTRKFDSKNINLNNCIHDFTKKNDSTQTEVIKILKNKKRKVDNRPLLEQLLKEVNDNGYVATGKKYGVTDNSIKKWIKSYGVEPPKKNKPYEKHDENFCNDCGIKLRADHKKCSDCYKKSREKFIAPPKEELLEKLKTMSTRETSKIYNVSANTICRWAKHHEIDLKKN